MSRPHPSVDNKENILRKRQEHPEQAQSTSSSQFETSGEPSKTEYKRKRIIKYVKENFCNKPLTKTGLGEKSYEKFKLMQGKDNDILNDLGTLYINKNRKGNKWKIIIFSPVLEKSFADVPPVFIPTAGRSSTACLNLSMKGRYVQIIVIHSKEKHEYMNRTSAYDELDVMVMDPKYEKKVGAHRYVI